MPATYDPQKGFLNGVRGLQYTDGKGDYSSRVLAGLGADVVMVDPPAGSPARSIGPSHHDEPGPENSLFHWQYNLGKRSVVLDLTAPDGRDQFKKLARRSDSLETKMMSAGEFARGCGRPRCD